MESLLVTARLISRLVSPVHLYVMYYFYLLGFLPEVQRGVKPAEFPLASPR